MLFFDVSLSHLDHLSKNDLVDDDDGLPAEDTPFFSNSKGSGSGSQIRASCWSCSCRLVEYSSRTMSFNFAQAERFKTDDSIHIRLPKRGLTSTVVQRHHPPAFVESNSCQRWVSKPVCCAHNTTDVVAMHQGSGHSGVCHSSIIGIMPHATSRRVV